MPIRENPSLPNRHTGYIAKSGGGKSQALKQNLEIPRSKARVIIWDPNRDHKKHSIQYPANQLEKFKRAVVGGMKSGKGFRLGLVGDQDEKLFDEQFCRLALTCLDGQRPLYIIIEELPAVQSSTSKASHYLQLLCNQSRKYGGILHWTTQTPAEVPKTIMKQTENFYIGDPGKFSTKSMDDRLALTAECTVADLKALKNLQFYRADSEKSELITLKYKNI